jgi:hypothetical protein
MDRLVANHTGAAMPIRTLLLYLIGNRQAILAIASDRRALGYGFLLVLSAGFAREYDGKDLLAEPWHLAIPFAASLLSSLLLFALLYGVMRFKGRNVPRFWASYRSFLSLFWMTAPLAWLYAIPYERFLTPLGATEANLWTLGVVAAWRVGLMVRVASVLMNTGLASAFFFVILLADVEAMVALFLMPMPVIQFMGGIRLSQSEKVIQGTLLWLRVASILTLPVWFIGAAATGGS